MLQRSENGLVYRRSYGLQGWRLRRQQGRRQLLHRQEGQRLLQRQQGRWQLLRRQEGQRLL